MDDAKSEVEQALGVAFTAHESGYRGGAYWKGSTDHEGESVIVQANAELEEPMEPVDLPTIVYVEGTSRAPDIASRLRGLSLVPVREDNWPQG